MIVYRSPTIGRWIALSRWLAVILFFCSIPPAGSVNVEEARSIHPQGYCTANNNWCSRPVPMFPLFWAYFFSCAVCAFVDKILNSCYIFFCFCFVGYMRCILSAVTVISGPANVDVFAIQFAVRQVYSSSFFGVHHNTTKQNHFNRFRSTQK